MATQGIVSVIGKGHSPECPKVLMKIVAGCEGYNAEKLAAALKEKWPVTAEEAYRLARKTPFGSGDCLVVLTPDGELFFGSADLSPSYRDTFNQPEWNPRWNLGTADNVEVITC